MREQIARKDVSAFEVMLGLANLTWQVHARGIDFGARFTVPVTIDEYSTLPVLTDKERVFNRLMIPVEHTTLGTARKKCLVLTTVQW